MNAQPGVFPSPATSVSCITPLHRQSLATPALSSEALLQGQREILIRHGDSVYRLRHTSNDKLILTK